MTALTTLADFLAGTPLAYESFAGEPLSARFGRVAGDPLTALTIRDTATNRLLMERQTTAAEAEIWFNHVRETS